MNQHIKKRLLRNLDTESGLIFDYKHFQRLLTQDYLKQTGDSQGCGAGYVYTPVVQTWCGGINFKYQLYGYKTIYGLQYRPMDQAIMVLKEVL